jgi:hypothetical protein
MPGTPTMVRNTAPGPAVFSDGGHHVEWAGSGDVMQNDLQPVPESFLDNVQFHRMVARGIFVVEQADEAIQAALAAHKQDFTERMARQQSASAASIDMAPDNDSLMKDCVGPAANGRGLCGQQVPIKVRAQAERPPLCPQHAELAGQYVARESDERVIGGKPEITWVPIQLGARTRQD